jgi:hypothetical protein
MAEIEEYLRMPVQRGLAILIIIEYRVLRDTIFLAESLLQQLISQHTESPSLLMLEFQGLLTALLQRFTGVMEATCTAVLLADLVSPLIDRYTVPRPYTF